ncbi:MAG: hypothetical protein ABSF99_09660 [Anaerolineales bacterium]|jgi:hypothetical protein
MLKKYLLIGILIITVTLVISAFTWIGITGSTGLLVGRSQDLVIVDKAQLDFIPPSLQQVASHVGLSKALVIVDDGKRSTISSSLLLAASQAGLTLRLVFVSAVSVSPYPYIFDPYLVVAPRYVDDHYPVPSNSYLTVVSTYHDR